MSDLKPCPFCGCTAIYVTHTHYYYDEDTVCMFCNGCKSVVILESNEGEGINDKARAEAIAAWNARAERTCEPTNCDSGEIDVDVYALSCGHVAYYPSIYEDAPKYCPECGARIEVGE